MNSHRTVLDDVFFSATETISQQITPKGLAPWGSAIPNAMTTAELLSAIRDTGGWTSAPDCHCLVAMLKTFQNQDGYWTDLNSSDPWDVSATAWVYWALRAMDFTPARLMCIDAANWLSRVALKSGGFPTNGNNAKANTYATSYALRAMVHSKRIQESSFAIRFLQESQNPDGGWGLYSGDDSEATLTCYVLHGLLDSGISPSSVPCSSAIRWLLNARSDAGLWGSWLNEETSVEGTAFALYILARSQHRFDSAEFAALEFLSGRVRMGRPWDIDGVTQNWMAITGILLWNAMKDKI